MQDDSKPSPSLPDQAELVARLRLAAEQGNAEAQFRLGVIYGNGDGVALDHEQALSWFNQAARQGHENAVITLAWMYANGTGVQVDEERARALYLMAADHGSAKAQYVVANMYRFAQFGAERDNAKSLRYYRLAADQGMANAQFALGKLMLEGKLVERDDAGALQWLMLADAGGSKRAGEYIRHLLQRMPADQVRQVRERMLGASPNGQD
jgi:uncharacterized protein